MEDAYGRENVNHGVLTVQANVTPSEKGTTVINPTK